MFDFRTAVAAAGRRCSAVVSAILARRLILPLLYANERMLRDIGLSRVDVVESLSGPLCADPSQLLIERINKKRAVAEARRKTAFAANGEESPPPVPQTHSLAA
jgi:hypothetical protein